MCVVALAASLAVPGCAAVEFASDAAPTAHDDGGDRAPPGFADAGSSMTRSEVDPDALLGDSCWNGIDEDENGLTDCDEPGCAATPFCCLGRSSAPCCVERLAPVSVDFALCEGSIPADCEPTASTFGQPAPRLDGEVPRRAFVPGGSERDSGLVFAAPLDATRARIELTARVAASATPCDDCVDVVAFGVGDPPLDELAPPRLDVAVLVRGSRGDVALVVAGEVVATLPLSDDATRPYTLTLQPDGQVLLTSEVGGPLTARWGPRPGLRALLYGRSQARTREGAAIRPARAEGLTISTQECEIPSALEVDADSPLPDPAWGLADARAPSARAEGGSLLVAFEHGGDIHLARLDADGTRALVGAPALRADPGESLRDPELAREGARWMLYVTREREDRSGIARAEGGATLAEPFGALVDVPGGEGLTAPAVAEWRGSTLVAAVSAEGSGIVLLELVEGQLERWRGLEESVVRARDDLHSFDADEVGGPALHVDGAGILRLYYAGRRGTRWRIGLVAAGDGETWLYAPEGPVLDLGPDSRAVRDPSVVVVAGIQQIFHTTSDDASSRVARATGRTRW